MLMNSGRNGVLNALGLVLRAESVDTKKHEVESWLKVADASKDVAWSAKEGT